MTAVNPADRSAFSSFPVGFKVRLVQVRVEVVDPPDRKPHRRVGPVYRVDPPGTCLICLGVGWTQYESGHPKAPCWCCRPAVDSRLESTRVGSGP